MSDGSSRTIPFFSFLQILLCGGVQEVTRLKKWAEIGRELGYARKQCTSMSNALKTAYQKVVLPYEIWYGKHKDDIDQFTLNEGMPLVHCYINPYTYFILFSEWLFFSY